MSRKTIWLWKKKFISTIITYTLAVWFLLDSKSECEQNHKIVNLNWQKHDSLHSHSLCHNNDISFECFNTSSIWRINLTFFYITHSSSSSFFSLLLLHSPPSSPLLMCRLFVYLYLLHHRPTGRCAACKEKKMKMMKRKKMKKRCWKWCKIVDAFPGFRFSRSVNPMIDWLLIYYLNWNANN